MLLEIGTISCALASGFLREILREGKAQGPLTSNSLRVFF